MDFRVIIILIVAAVASVAKLSQDNFAQINALQELVVSPTPTPTLELTSIPTPSPSLTPTPTVKPTSTPKPTVSVTPKPTSVPAPVNNTPPGSGYSVQSVQSEKGTSRVATVAVDLGSTSG